MPEKTINASDEDAGKGAVEQDRPEQKSNVSLAGQIGHRDQDPMLKASNSDYGEPGQNEEHTGEARTSNALDRDSEQPTSAPHRRRYATRIRIRRG
jgi:hypothetical protein